MNSGMLLGGLGVGVGLLRRQKAAVVLGKPKIKPSSIFGRGKSYPVHKLPHKFPSKTVKFKPTDSSLALSICMNAGMLLGVLGSESGPRSPASAPSMGTPRPRIRLTVDLLSKDRPTGLSTLEPKLMGHPNWGSLVGEEPNRESGRLRLPAGWHPGHAVRMLYGHSIEKRGNGRPAGEEGRRWPLR